MDSSVSLLESRARAMDVYMYMNLVLVYIVSPQHEGQTKGCKVDLSTLVYKKRRFI